MLCTRIKNMHFGGDLFSVHRVLLVSTLSGLFHNNQWLIVHYPANYMVT